MSVLEMKSELVKQVPIARTNAKPRLLGVMIPMCVHEGVIGYDMFANFIVAIDRVGEKMAFVKG